MLIERIVNWLCDNFIGDYEYHCPRCNGKGRYEKKHTGPGSSRGISWKTIEICEKCKGTGHLDWTQKVAGKK